MSAFSHNGFEAAQDMANHSYHSGFNEAGS